MQQGSSSPGSDPNAPAPRPVTRPYVPPEAQVAQVAPVTRTTTQVAGGTIEANLINPAPAGMATAVFIFREIIALLFVFAWLGMLGYDIFIAADEVVPFWLNVIGVGVLAYALGVNVENLTAFKGMSTTRTMQ